METALSWCELHLSLDGAQDSDLLAEGIEEVSEIQVGELPIEALQNQVQASDHIAAELQGKGCLNGTTTALEGRPVDPCRCKSLAAPHYITCGFFLNDQFVLLGWKQSP